MVTEISRSRRALTLAAGAAALAGPWIAPARAADYPGGPLRIVVPYPAGGFNDTLGRLIAKQLSAAWKVSAVVDNKPGANTVIGSDALAKNDWSNSNAYGHALRPTFTTTSDRRSLRSRS